MLKLDITKVAPFVSAETIKGYATRAAEVQQTLEDGTCPGNDFLGWLHLPAASPPTSWPT